VNTETPFPSDDAEREWQAQERALRHERLGLDPAGDDSAVRRYRAVSRALAEPPAIALPADFALRVARLAEDPTSADASDTRFERVLTWLLGAGLGIVALAVLIVYGGTVLPTTENAMPAGLLTNQWLWTLAACALVSAMPQWLGARRG
jgi:hypothetical protein